MSQADNQYPETGDAKGDNMMAERWQKDAEGIIIFVRNKVASSFLRTNLW